MTLLFNVTKVKEVMTPHPVLISPNDTLEQAAKKMETIDCGALPVGTDKELSGMITDRDIVIRALAHGKNPAREKVGSYMTHEVYGCNEGDSLETAAETMHKYKVSRLIVRDDGGQVTGILSFGTLFRNEADPKDISEVVKHCSGPVSV